jgi:hypothetical protein
MDKYDPDLIHKILKELVPQNMNVAVISQDYANDTNKITEKWYGTEYIRTKMEKVIHICSFVDSFSFFAVNN